ncbi:MAG TPA: hypothetical protein VMT46_09685 [Anaerolineaceae bacterium]|nr:hypothetical protein [Anaerolineaceae bacterium]
MSRRLLGFALAILVGLAAGLVYGWVINPVKYVDTTPDTLRADYKTDYVLMVAEIYRASPDLDQAARRLALLGSQSPAELAREAALAARAGDFPQTDQDALDVLSRAFQTWTPVARGATPQKAGTP